MAAVCDAYSAFASSDEAKKGLCPKGGTLGALLVTLEACHSELITEADAARKRAATVMGRVKDAQQQYKKSCIALMTQSDAD